MHNIAAVPRGSDGGPLSDEVALVRAAREEPSAFGTLYDRYLGRNYAYLRALLGALGPDTRELLALRFAAGLTFVEIAAVVGKSEAATKKRLARTLQSLKEHYHDDAR